MDWFPVLLSLKVAAISSILVLLVGIPLARFMAKKYFFGKDIIEAILLLPLVLPPSVLGFMLLMLLGSNGVLGQILSDLGIQVIFTSTACVIAAFVVSLPLFYQSAKASFSQVDHNLELAAKTLGAGKIRSFFTVSLPLAFPGIISGLVLAFARGLGEFGATMMIAGNIPGVTQTLPLAVYFAVESGNYTMAAKLVLLITLFSFAVILWSNTWQRKYHLTK